MKYVKILICVTLLFVLNEVSYSQTLQFCEKVSDKGAAINPKTLFSFDKGKEGTVKFLVKLPFSIGTSKVTYELYTVGQTGAETFARSIGQDVGSDWLWFWKDVKFTKDASYNVKVYDGNGNHLVTSHLTIQYN